MHRRLKIASVVALSMCIAALVVAPASAQSVTTGNVVHVVAWGETLFHIAPRYGVTVEAIVAANDLTSADRISVGQRLIIPVTGESAPAATGGTSHSVQLGENLFRIGLQYGLTTEALAQANNMTTTSPLYAGQVLSIPGTGTPQEAPAAQVGTHTVSRGETLYRIGQRYGVSVDALSAANGLYNPGQLYVGQTLTIPGAANVPTAGYTPDQASVTHVVSPGETISSISQRYGVSQTALMQVNSIGNPSLLVAGQSLTIPVVSALTNDSNAGAGKTIRVDLSDQRTYVYQNGRLAWTFVVSTGIPGSGTWTGTFHVQNKLPNAYASTWDLQMPWWLGIYWAGPLQNGFHALPILSNGHRLWSGLLGSPASYGCIVLGEDDARHLYEWAEIGTQVDIVQ